MGQTEPNSQFFRCFLQIFALPWNYSISEAKIFAENHRKQQIFAENRRFSQKTGLSHFRFQFVPFSSALDLEGAHVPVSQSQAPLPSLRIGGRVSKSLGKCQLVDGLLRRCGARTSEKN